MANLQVNIEFYIHAILCSYCCYSYSIKDIKVDLTEKINFDKSIERKLYLFHID